MAKRKQPKRIRESKRKSVALRVGQVEKIVKAEMRAEIQQAAAQIVRSPGRPRGATAFQRVTQARELLAKSSVMAVKCLQKASKIAAAKGDSAPAEFLLKHVGAQDDKGKTVRPLHTSVDKVDGGGASRAPTINIGWIQPAPTLPADIIDVLPEPQRLLTKGED